MAAKENPRAEMPFLDHLEELRWRLIKVAMAIVVASGIGFLLVHYLDLTALLVHPITPYLQATPGVGGASVPGKLQALSPATPFFLELKLSLTVGIVLAFPILLYQAWAFLAPALEDRERKYILPSLYLGLVLFTLGVVLAYLVALPLSLGFFYGIQQDYIAFNIEANEYFAFVVRMLIGFGVVFEVPVLIMILTSLGLMTPRYLRAKRRHAMVLMVIMGAVLSPGDAPQYAVLMAGPLTLLYEFGILLSAFVHRRKQAEDPSEMGPPEDSVERILGWIVLWRIGVTARPARSGHVR